jgi:hypothetical protein
MRRSLRLILLGSLFTAAPLVVAGGCQQALFPADAPRTQFENHHRMRGRVAPATEPDIFGNPQPALRARLSQNY